MVISSPEQVEVVVVEPELAAQLLQAPLEPHEGLSHPLDLLGRQRAALDAPQRLALHELADDVDEREHQPGEPLLDVLGVGLDAAAQRGAQAVEVAHVKLHGGQGPVQTSASPPSWRSSRWTPARKRPTAGESTR